MQKQLFSSFSAEINASGTEPLNTANFTMVQGVRNVAGKEWRNLCCGRTKFSAIPHPIGTKGTIVG
jgi:hypothetical protein